MKTLANFTEAKKPTNNKRKGITQITEESIFMEIIEEWRKLGVITPKVTKLEERIFISTYVHEMLRAGVAQYGKKKVIQAMQKFADKGFLKKDTRIADFFRRGKETKASYLDMLSNYDEEDYFIVK